jgi:cytochrome c oxidase subunit 2
LWFRAVETGTFPILCSQMCGTGHSTMRGEVVVLDSLAYEAWLANQPVDLAQRGQEVAARKGCLQCHSLDGTAQVGPTFAGLYDRPTRLTDGRTVIADDAYLTESMMEPLAKVVDGFRPVMPTFQGLLEPADTAALLELIRSLKDVPPVGEIRQVTP